MKWTHLSIATLIGFCAGYFVHMSPTPKATGITMVETAELPAENPSGKKHFTSNKSAPTFDPQAPDAEEDRLSSMSLENIDDDEPISLDEFRALSQNDTLGASSLLMTLSDTNLQQRLSGELIDHWSDIDPHAAYLWFEQNQNLLDPLERGYYETMVILKLAKQDPDEAAGIIDTITDQGKREQLLVGLAGGLVHKDPEAAFNWIESLASSGEDPSTLKGCYEAIMHHYMEVNPVAAATAISELNSKSLQAEMAQAIIGKLAENNLDEALYWAQSLTYPEAQRWAMEELLYGSTSDSIEPIFSQIVRNASVSQEGIEFLKKTFAYTSQTDPDLSIAQFQQLPLIVQADVAGPMVSAMLNTDPEQAEQWLLAQPRGPLFSAGATAAAAYYSNVDLSLAIQWSGQIADAQKSTEIIWGIIGSAGLSDLPRIQEALDQINLSPQDQSALENLLDERIRDAYSPLVLPGS